MNRCVSARVRECVSAFSEGRMNPCNDDTTSAFADYGRWLVRDDGARNGDPDGWMPGRAAPAHSRTGALTHPFVGQSPTWSTARKASCGISTVPTCFIRFFPSFCFSSSLRLREMSPP